MSRSMDDINDAKNFCPEFAKESRNNVRFEYLTTNVDAAAFSFNSPVNETNEIIMTT